MQIENTVEATAVPTPQRHQSARSRQDRRLIRAVATIVACLCGLGAIGGFAATAAAQGSLPATACTEFEKWERGQFNPQYVDIALLPLKDVDLPANLESVVNGLAGRKFQGQAEEQAIQKLIEFYKAGCSGAGGNAAGAVAATTNAAANAAATPAATSAPTVVTPTPSGTPAAGATPAPKPTPATSLPNTGFNRASSGLAMLGGWLLLTGVAVTLFNRQRN